MKAEQPEKTHLEESARNETQLRSQGPLLALPRLHVAHETNKAVASHADILLARHAIFPRWGGKIAWRAKRMSAWEANKADDRWNYYKEIFPIIIDDRSVWSIRLFPMIDYEISADSQHYYCTWLWSSMWLLPYRPHPTNEQHFWKKKEKKKKETTA